MATKYSTYILHCQTGVHAGDGTSTGTIDMPIQREKTTDFPTFRDTVTRGAIREHIETPLLSLHSKETDYPKEFIATFGYRKNGDKASALSVLPSRLLFFPVRSFKDVFAYVTCPFILNRFIKEMQLFHKKEIKLNIELLNVKEDEAFASKNLTFKGNDENTYTGLDDFIFKLKSESFDISTILDLIDTKSIERLENHIAIINDTQFAYFTRLFTEKATRNKIDIETGVAEKNGLFNEEFLPEESILYSTFGFSNEFSTDKGRLSDEVIQNYFNEKFNSLFQLGGDKSVGKGLINPSKLNTELKTDKA